MNVSGTCALPPTNWIQQRWWDAFVYKYTNTWHKVVLSILWGDSLFLDGFEEIRSHVEKIYGKELRDPSEQQQETAAHSPKTSKELNTANTTWMWKQILSQASNKTKPNDPLIQALERTQLSHAWTSDPQKQTDPNHLGSFINTHRFQSQTSEFGRGKNEISDSDVYTDLNWCLILL